MPIPFLTRPTYGGSNLVTQSELDSGLAGKLATGSFAYYVIPFAFKGELALTTGTLRAPVSITGTIVKVFAKVGTAPTGAAILVDLNYNGTTIWTGGTNRINIAVSTNSDTETTFSTSAVTEDGYLTCDIDQIGSTIKGSDLTVFVLVRYTLS
jgi:hypothetical protein